MRHEYNDSILLTVVHSVCRWLPGVTGCAFGDFPGVFRLSRSVFLCAVCANVVSILAILGVGCRRAARGWTGAQTQAVAEFVKIKASKEAEKVVK